MSILDGGALVGGQAAEDFILPPLFRFDQRFDFNTINLSSQSILTTGDGMDVELLPSTLVERANLLPNVNFRSEYEGFIEIEPTTNGIIHAELLFTHKFGTQPEFTSRREYEAFTRSNTILSIPFNVFDSVTRLKSGSITTSDGTMVTITDEDLLGPVTISATLRITALQPNGRRLANTVDINSFKIAGHFQQLNPSTARASSDEIDNRFATISAENRQINSKITTLEDADTTFENEIASLEVADRQGVYELSENSDKAVRNTVLLNERNVPSLFATGQKYYVSGGDEGGLHGKIIRRNSTTFEPGSNDHGFDKYWEVLDLGVEDAVDFTNVAGAVIATADEILFFDKSDNNKIKRTVPQKVVEAGKGLLTTGGTMTGDLTLDGAPTDNLHAATKKYVDDNAGNGGEDSKALGDFATAPDADDYDENDVILIDGNRNVRRTTHATIENNFEGTTGLSRQIIEGVQWRGVVGTTGISGFTHRGTFTANPNNTIAYIMASTDNRLRIAFKLDVYETAKGSAVASGDELKLLFNIGGNPNTTTVEYILTQSQQTDNTKKFAVFGHTGTSFHPLYGALGGTAWGLLVHKTDDTPFFTHATNTEHWVQELSVEDITQQTEIDQVNREIDRLDLRTLDIYLGVHAQTGWGPVNSNGNDGGIGLTTGTDDLDFIKALTYNAPSVQPNGNFPIVRVPKGSSRASYGIRIDSNFLDYDIPLTDMRYKGSDDNWDYYEELVRQYGTATLRSNSRTTGQNTWAGLLETGMPSKTAVHSEGVRNIVRVTQTEYDAIETKDPNTLYIVNNNGTLSLG